MYKETKQLNHGKLTCPKCSLNTFRYTYSKIICINCGWTQNASMRTNKYGAKRTVAQDGIKRDSKFEATIADQLLLRKKAKEILDYDSQYKVEIPIYDKDGDVVHIVRHKVDFRLHHKDGSFELLEAKGKVLPDYQWRRMLLEKVWLPENKNHTYTVVFQK